MADYRQFCGTCGASLGFGSTHYDSCKLSPRHDTWLKAQEFKRFAEARDFEVKQDWLVCKFCYCLVEKSVIGGRTHRHGCDNQYIAGKEATTSLEIKDMIQNG